MITFPLNADVQAHYLRCCGVTRAETPFSQPGGVVGRSRLSAFTQSADNNWIFVAAGVICADAAAHRVKQG